VSRFVPLIDEGGDDLELSILHAARHDVPPDGSARDRTLEALRVAAAPAAAAAVVGVGASLWKGVGLFGSTASKLVMGGLGVVLVTGSAALVVQHVTTAELTPASEVMTPAPVQARPAGHGPSQPSMVSAAPPPAASVPSAPAVQAPLPLLTAASAPVGGLEGRGVRPAAVAPAAAVSQGAAEAWPVVEGATQREQLGLEAAALEAARKALPSDAAGALVAIDRYDARFPSGALAEEATVLRVQALLTLGRRADATAVVDAFQRQRPASSYVGRLRALLERNL
jgi:hypothetical protein